MSYRYERYNDRRRQSPMRCLFISVVALVWIVLLGILLFRYVVQPYFVNQIRERIAERVPVQQPAPEIVVPESNLVPETIQPGSYTVSEADANQWIAQNQGAMQGVDAVSLRFVPGEAQADVTIRGITSTARAGVAVVNGRVTVTNPRLDPPLGMIVDVQPLAQLMEERLNGDLAATGRTVTGATIEAGQVVITVE